SCQRGTHIQRMFPCGPMTAPRSPSAMSECSRSTAGRNPPGSVMLSSRLRAPTQCSSQLVQKSCREFQDCSVLRFTPPLGPVKGSRFQPPVVYMEDRDFRRPGSPHTRLAGAHRRLPTRQNRSLRSFADRTISAYSEKWSSSRPLIQAPCMSALCDASSRSEFERHCTGTSHPPPEELMHCAP